MSTDFHPCILLHFNDFMYHDCSLGVVYVPVLLHCGAVSGGINIINHDGAILLNSSTFTG